MTPSDIAKNMTETVSITEHPKYKSSPFLKLTQVSNRTKGKLMEAMVAEILSQEGHEVLERTNKDHDLRVRFGNENHKTKIEVKGALMRRDSDDYSISAFLMAHDFDELFILFVEPEGVQGWRINRSILRGMDDDGLMGLTKGAKMFGSITPEVLAKYDCKRVF